MLGMSIAAFNGTLDEEEQRKILDDYEIMTENLKEVEEQTKQWYERHKFSLLRKIRLCWQVQGTCIRQPMKGTSN